MSFLFRYNDPELPHHQIKEFKEFLKSGASTSTILMAIHENNLPALKILIDGGANPCFADQYGRVPEDYLNENTSPELRKYFKGVIAEYKKNENRAIKN